MNCLFRALSFLVILSLGACKTEQRSPEKIGYKEGSNGGVSGATAPAFS